MNDWEEFYEEFDKIKSQHFFKSVWSLSYKRVLPKDMNKKTKFIIKKLTYNTYGFGKDIVVNIELKNPTWLELWNIAEKMIQESGDTSHIFIEDFRLVNAEKMEYTLITGS